MIASKIYAVDQTQVRIAKSKPPILLIHATGRTTTSGWTDGQLSPYVYLFPPEDGVQEYDFIATPPGPGQIVQQVLTPISATAEIPDMDILNYWGEGNPLKGIRVHGISNNKTVDIVPKEETTRIDTSSSPQSVVSHVTPTDNQDVPGFGDDIKPLFRDRDVSVMQAIAGFNLHNYDDVKSNADRIFERLQTDMPCDGLWPQNDIDKFERWKDEGMPQ